MPETALAPANLDAFLAPVADVRESGGSPYVTYAFKMSPKFTDYAAQISGLKEAEAVLVQGDQYTRLSPLKLHVLASKTLYVEREDGKEALRATDQQPARGSKSDLVEENHMAAIVYDGENLVPVSIVFKKALAQGANRAAKELNACQTPEWLDRSPDHRAAGSIKVPFGRFTATITSGFEMAKSSGRQYPISKAEIKPITAAEAANLKEFLGDPDNVVAINDVTARVLNNIQELLALGV